MISIVRNQMLSGKDFGYFIIFTFELIPCCLRQNTPRSYCMRKCLFFYLTFNAAGLLFFVSWWVFLGGICFSTSASPQDRQGQVYGSGRQALPSLKAHTHTSRQTNTHWQTDNLIRKHMCVRAHWSGETDRKTVTHTDTHSQTQAGYV